MTPLTRAAQSAILGMSSGRDFAQGLAIPAHNFRPRQRPAQLFPETQTPRRGRIACGPPPQKPERRGAVAAAPGVAGHYDGVPDMPIVPQRAPGCVASLARRVAGRL